MSDGRTYWWACDAAYFDRERVADLALTFGPIGPCALLWLCCHAKELNDGGKVKSGYSAVAKAIGARRTRVRDVVLYAVEIGALDEFVESPDERRFEARVSGWTSDQERALGALRQARYRERNGESMPSDGVSRSVTTSDENRDRTGTERDSLRSSLEHARASCPAAALPFVNPLLALAEAKGCEVALNRLLVTATQHGAGRDLGEEAERCRFYFVEGKGHRRPMRDVTATWRNWLKTAPDAKAPTARRSSAQPVRAERIDDAALALVRAKYGDEAAEQALAASKEAAA